VAERIGKEHGYDQVIINARRANADDTAVTLEWVTTWGKNKLHCDIAARIGNAIRDNVAPTIDRLNDALARETARADAAVAEAKALREELETQKIRSDVIADSNFLAGVTAGWNANSLESPGAAEAELAALKKSRDGHCAPLKELRDREARATLAQSRSGSECDLPADGGK
jgi:hypothetical protein